MSQIHDPDKQDAGHEPRLVRKPKVSKWLPSVSYGRAMKRTSARAAERKGSR